MRGSLSPEAAGALLGISKDPVALGRQPHSATQLLHPPGPTESRVQIHGWGHWVLKKYVWCARVDKPVLWSVLGKKNSDGPLRGCLLEGGDAGFSFFNPSSSHKLASWTLAELCHHVLLSVALKDPILTSGGRLDTLRPRTVQTLVESLSQNDLRKLT